MAEKLCRGYCSKHNTLISVCSDEKLKACFVVDMKFSAVSKFRQNCFSVRENLLHTRFKGITVLKRSSGNLRLDITF